MINFPERPLGLAPVAQSRKGRQYGTGPTIVYEVTGLPGAQKISIRNVRPSEEQPVWQIGVHIKGRQTRWMGQFRTADEALAHVQSKLENPEEFGNRAATKAEILTIHQVGPDYIELTDRDRRVRIRFADDETFSKEESAVFFRGLENKPAAIPVDGPFFIAVDFWKDWFDGTLRVIPFTFNVSAIERF